MRSHVQLIAVLAFAISIPSQITYGQVTVDDIIDGINAVDRLLGGNNNPNNNPNTGRDPNPVGIWQPGVKHTEGPFPPGTKAVIAGPGVAKQQTFKLPASVVVFPDGSMGQSSAVVSGNRLMLDNRSAQGVVVEYLLPQNNPRPSPRPTPPTRPAPAPNTKPNNLPSAGVGDVEVRNRSGASVMVRYKLPRGKTYPNRGKQVTDLWINLRNRYVDTTDDIAQNTRVTVDGFVEEAFVPRDGTLKLIVHQTYIETSVVGNPPTNPTPSPTPTPNPTPNPTPGTNPIPTGPVAGVPKNDMLAISTKPLTGNIASELGQRINEEVLQLLSVFDEGSARRAKALVNEMVDDGFDGDAAGDLVGIVVDGDPTNATAFFDELKQQGVKAKRTHQSSCLAIATFREKLSSLLTKVESGQTATAIKSDFTTLKQQASTLGAAGLADALTLCQRDLMIRDTIHKAAKSSILNTGSPGTPRGEVMMIRHPWLTARGPFVGEDSVVLTRSPDENIVVAKAPARTALGLPLSIAPPIDDATSTDGQITIVNRAENRVALNYTFGGKKYGIAPGETHRYEVGTNSLFQFDQGNGSGLKKYTLKEAGKFVFVLANGKWDLKSQEISIRLLNPAHNSIDLHYLVDGKATTLASGESAEHKSKQPLMIQFDRYDGTATATKLLDTDADYHFALNDVTEWDLFSGDSPVLDYGGTAMTITRPELAVLQKTAGTKLFDFSGATTVATSGSGNSLLDDLKDAE